MRSRLSRRQRARSEELQITSKKNKKLGKSVRPKKKGREERGGGGRAQGCALPRRSSKPPATERIGREAQARSPRTREAGTVKVWLCVCAVAVWTCCVLSDIAVVGSACG
eukprot:2557493-Prymnesium_polylepis.2